MGSRLRALLSPGAAWWQLISSSNELLERVDRGRVALDVDLGSPVSEPGVYEKHKSIYLNNNNNNQISRICTKFLTTQPINK